MHLFSPRTSLLVEWMCLVGVSGVNFIGCMGVLWLPSVAIAVVVAGALALCCTGHRAIICLVCDRFIYFALTILSPNEPLFYFTSTFSNSNFCPSCFHFLSCIGALQPAVFQSTEKSIQTCTASGPRSSTDPGKCSRAYAANLCMLRQLFLQRLSCYFDSWKNI